MLSPWRLLADAYNVIALSRAIAQRKTHPSDAGCRILLKYTQDMRLGKVIRLSLGVCVDGT
jgi:hypothetical protein